MQSKFDSGQQQLRVSTVSYLQGRKRAGIYGKTGLSVKREAFRCWRGLQHGSAMVKAYLRYEHAAAFGVISSGCNVLYDASGKQLFTGALENIAIWNLRQGSLVSSSRSSNLPSAQPGICS